MSNLKDPPEIPSSDGSIASLSVSECSEKLKKRTKQSTSATEKMNEEESSFFQGDIIEDDITENPRNASCGRGIIDEARQTVGTYWIQEMTNFNQKTVAVTFFLFFACIAPAITFGAVFSKVTHNWIGAVEMITATAIVGIIYPLIGGQPMMINGGTGPMLAFTTVLYKLSESLEVPFLTFYTWVGLWVCFFMILAAFFDMNRYIMYATRFTDEIFAFLISSIFIIDALGSPISPVGIYYYFVPSHKSHDEYEDDEDYSYMAAAFLSLNLCLGTTYLAFLLRKVKFSPFCPNNAIRSTITDFAVVTAIAVFTLLDNMLFSSIQTERLNIPDTFAPSFLCCTYHCTHFFPDDCPDITQPYGRRPWLVDLTNLNNKHWIPFLAPIPAFLAFILVFLDDGITKHLINHPSRKLTHGAAYNYDSVIIGLLVAVSSMLGLPWLVAATVRSLNHVNALSKKERSGRVVSVQETRLTHLFIHILVLISIFAISVLKIIPMPVLYGVFLFMGLASLEGNQFFHRITMFFMQPSRFPEEPFTTHMATSKMHLFTIIQFVLFSTLYVVKSIKAIAIAFPIIIAICIPIRRVILPKIFTKDELLLIDSGEEEELVSWLTMRGLTDTEVNNEMNEIEMTNGRDTDEVDDMMGVEGVGMEVDHEKENVFEKADV